MKKEAGHTFLAKLGKNVLDLVVAKLPIGSLRRGILQKINVS